MLGRMEEEEGAMRPIRAAGRGGPGWRVLLALLDLLLLPAALVAVLAEAVLERGGRRAGRRLTALMALPAPVRDRMARLPGWAAMTLFLVPYLASDGGKVAAVVLLVEGKVLAAAITYLASKLVALALVLGIYRACEARLLGVRWFAWAHGGAGALRVRAAGMLRRATTRTARFRPDRIRRGALAARFHVLRRRLGARRRD